MNDIFTLAKNFTGSFANHLADGLKKSSEEEFEKRMEICRNCDQYNSEQNRCNNCGCFLKIKASWNSEKCPLNKW